MKEIKMDWDTYQQEIKKCEEQSGHHSLSILARWLEGKETLENTLYFYPELESALSRIAKALGREKEFNTVTKEVAA